MSDKIASAVLREDPSAATADPSGNTLHAAELHTDASSAPVDYGSMIDQLFLNYVGRHATPVEILSLGNLLTSGAETIDSARAEMVAGFDSHQYLPNAIALTYVMWGGRAVTGDEVAVWTNEMSLHGATLATVRNAILTDPLGQGFTTGIVTQAYLTWGGRAPTVGELAAWNAQFMGGTATPTQVQAAVENDPLGITYATGIITAAYQQWGGRAPTQPEIDTWLGTLHNGGSFADIKAGILADPLGVNYLNQEITQVYQQWGGRAPTTDELTTWRDTLANHGGTIDRLKADIVADPLGTNYIAQQVTQIYQQWGGRAPTTAELATWHDTLAQPGVTLDRVKADILADPLGTNYASSELATLFASHGWGTTTQSDVDALMAQLRAGQSFDAAAATIAHHNTIDPAVLTQIYDGFAAFLGRAPSAIEAGNWTATVQADGTGLDTLRSTMMSGTEGQGYVAAQVTAAYQQLAGRVPTTGEIAAWQDTIANQGGTLDAMRHAIVDSPDGQALAAPSIGAAFTEYLGRAPTTGEAQTELDGLAQGRTIEGIGAELFTSSEGVIHFQDELAALFPQLLGHQASQAESDDWFDALFQGATYETMRATLMLDAASTATHLTGTTAADRFALGTSPGDVVISAFDAVNDSVVLDQSYASVNLLDAAHATQVLSRDGETPNVLIKLDDHDTLLLHGVTLAQLSSADFVFA